MPRLRLELAGLEALGRVLPAPDEHVHLNGGPAQRGELAGRGDEHADSGAPRAARATSPLTK